MKLLSWNVRGLGGAAKRREVSHLVRENKPFILCLQETTLPMLDAFVCNSIWGDVIVDFSYRPSEGASGGIATLWNSNEVEVWSSVSLDHALVVDGRFLKSGEQFVVFNVVRCVEERRSVSSVPQHAGIDDFNTFIDSNLLVDLPLRGRTFTWFRGDGRSMSHIDRILLSENWCLTWPTCFQLAVSRGLSDHCPLVLAIDTQN